MDVPVTELRDHLTEWLERVRGGAEVVVTDSGLPIAKLLGLSATATLERLAADGASDVSAPLGGRPFSPGFL